jgi:hypothetical protein
MMRAKIRDRTKETEMTDQRTIKVNGTTFFMSSKTYDDVCEGARLREASERGELRDPAQTEWDSERRDSPYSTVADASDDSYCEFCDQETVADDRAYGGVRCGCDKDYPVYVASKGGQDRYVETIVAQSPDEALDRLEKRIGVEGVRETVGGQRRIQTKGVSYYYVYLDR